MEPAEPRFDRRAVERILTRAVRESSALDDETLDVDDLRRIAKELDVPFEALDAAIVAELAGTRSPHLDRGRLVPRAVEAGRGVANPPDVTRAMAHTWLGRHEGLRLCRTDGQVETWEKDPTLLASIRSALKLRGGTGQLRDLAPLQVIVAGSGDQSHVSIGAETVAPRATAALIGAAGVAGGVLLSAFVGGWAWVALFLPLLVASIALGVATGRGMARANERHLERALDGIEFGAPPTEDSVVDVIGDLRGAVGTKRPRTEPPTKKRHVDIRWE